MNTAMLEDWLTKEGNRIIRKITEQDLGSLSDAERLLYEIWLLDTEQRNGGVSQYFCNRGLAQWNSLSRLATATLASFASFATHVDKVVGTASDPYQAVTDSEVDLDGWYDKYRFSLIEELKATYQPAK